MSRRCELTGTGPMSGWNSSHANNKTKRSDQAAWLEKPGVKGAAP